MKIALMFYWCLIILAQNQLSEGAIPNHPKQKLSKECFDLMQISLDFDCPVYSEPNDSIFEEMYNVLNKTCCDIYDGLEFHCQMYYSQDGTQFSKFGCLKTVVVPPGFGGQIEHYDTGHPVFKVEKYSGDEFHEQRLSWQVSYNYPVNSKSRCDGLGVDILCENFEGDDDRKCTCKLGFCPNDSACLRGFTDRDICFCQEMDCPKGLCPSRSFVAGNHSCKEMDFSSLNFTCIPCVNHSEPETVSTVVTQNNTFVTMNQTLDTVSNCTTMGISTISCDEGTDNFHLVLIIVTAVSVALLLIIFIACVVFIRRRKLPKQKEQIYSPVTSEQC